MLGVDFGTSTTVVAAYLNGQPTLLSDPEGDLVMPSAVAHLPGNRVAIGRKAHARRLIDPLNTLHSFKRIIGLPWFDTIVAEERKKKAFELERGEDGLPRYCTRAGKHTAQDLARQIFENVRRYTGVPSSFMGKVVVTAPPAFEPSQRDAIAQAARDAGFSHVTLIDEAYAAILPYLKHGEPPQTVIVYDLGGGTFDVAVLKIMGMDFEILATGGDPYLGGDDLDHAIAETAALRVLEQFQWDIRTSAASFQNFRGLCQQAKVRLSVFPEAQIPLGIADTVLGDKQITVTQADLQRPVYDLLQRTFAVCDDILHRAGIVSQQVDKVVLVGGSTYLPSIRDAVGKYFEKPLVTSNQADCQVALGACLHASLEARNRVA